MVKDENCHPGTRKQLALKRLSLNLVGRAFIDEDWGDDRGCSNIESNKDWAGDQEGKVPCENHDNCT